MPPELPGDIDPELLGRYLAGECSEAEAAVVRRYLMARPRAARVLGQFLTSLDADEARPPAPDASASWVALRDRLHDHPGANARAPKPGTHVAERHRWRTGRTLAVAAAVLAAVTYVGTHRWAPGATEPGATETESAVAARTYVTESRERAELRLADGTRVYLAPRSRLRVAADYGTARRDVSLEGEGFFDVVHDVRRPFTVFAGNARARDLGTVFAVRSYAADHAVQVIVRSGAVALSGVGRLARGDVGRLTGDGGASIRRGIDVDALLGWLHGTLVFQDTPLGQVLQDLGRWYDVDARLTDPALAALPFTGTLDTQDAEYAVRLVAATLGLRVRRDGAQFVLAPTRGRTPQARAPVASPATTLAPARP